MIKDLLENKTFLESADIKSEEILKLSFSGEYIKNEIKVEILNIGKINGGIEVFAKGWKNGEQFGFGLKGDVEIERFKIFNPPVLIEDPLGNIPVVFTVGKDIEVIKYFREDPYQALIDELTHTISLVGKVGSKISIGKIGNTTSTFYSQASPATTAMNAYLKYSNAAGESWATITGQTDATTVSDSAAAANAAYTYSDETTNEWEDLFRGMFLFDTSALPDSDNISSATFSLFGNGSKWDSSNLAISIVASSPASNTSVAAADFNNFNSTKFASDLDITSWNTAAYNDFALNASGIAAISKTGITKFGTRLDADVSGVAPSWSSNVEDGVACYFANQTGTTNDPKLVVVHSAAGPANVKTWDGIASANIKTIDGINWANTQ